MEGGKPMGSSEPFDLPVEFKPLFYLAVGLIIGLMLLGMPEKVLQKTGKLPGLSPNWITFWRLPATMIGYLIYFRMNVFIGYCIVVFACVLDRMDGKVANALANLNDPQHPGKTETGQWLDPLIDKLTFLPPIVFFWWKGIFIGHFVAVMIAAEVSGTLIRRPFSLFENSVRTNSASGFSKLKALIQLFCLLTCLPLDQHWMNYGTMVPNTLLGIAMVMAILSVIARLKLGKKTEKIVDSLTGAFQHYKE